MGDSDSMRARRYRAHRAGDHSLCRPEACDAVAGDHVVGSIEAAVRALAERMVLGDDDPRAVMLEMALRLAGVVDVTPTATDAVRELRSLLAWLAEHPRAADEGQGVGDAELSAVLEGLG